MDGCALTHTPHHTQSAPQKALDFFVFEALKAALDRRRSRKLGGRRGAQQAAAAGGGGAGGAGTLVAAGLAGVTSLTLLYPLEVQLQGEGQSH